MHNSLQLSYSCSPKSNQYSSLMTKVFDNITFDGEIYYDDIAYHALGRNNVVLKLLYLTYIISNQKEHYNALVATFTNNSRLMNINTKPLTSVSNESRIITRNHFNVLGRILIIPHDKNYSIRNILSSLSKSSIITYIEGFEGNDISYEGDIEDVFQYLSLLLNKLSNFEFSIEFIMKTSSWSKYRKIDFDHN